MDFKQALIAHLNGEAVQVRHPGGLAHAPYGWCPFNRALGEVKLKDLREGAAFRHEFRIKPRTVMCNGVEVPAPESVAPAVGTQYYTPDTRHPESPHHYKWANDALDEKLLCANLVYIRKDDCIGRTKAMLIVSQ